MQLHQVEINGIQEEDLSNERILVLKGITKSFPGIKVLDGVDIDIKKGEVHALLGENGAGKSTLMKIISGIHSPDNGDIIYQGEKINIQNPLDAKNRGILLIHQEISLVPELTVAENIFLGSIPVKQFHKVDWKLLRRKSREILDDLHCTFSENELAGHLTIAHQQMVEISRAIAFKPNIVIFDEPTASLTDQEKDVLFKIIRKLKNQGVAMIYISHRMDEIFEISDRITVLRDGKKTGTLSTSDTTSSEVTKLMIGREIGKNFKGVQQKVRDEFLRLEGLSKKGLYHDISFSIHRGEVLGLYGLIGAGRSELAETIFGIRKPNSGKIYVNGQEKRIANSTTAVRLGIGFVPEDRKKQGLVLNMGGQENITLAKINQLQNFGFIRNQEEESLFKKYKEKLSIKTSSAKNPVVNLSGGNQQKIIIAKWLSMSPKLFILDEPTRGIDVGSKSEIHKLIRKMAEDGFAILVISSEMPEIMGVSDRIITMYQGEITAELTGETVTESHLIHGATGQLAL